VEELLRLRCYNSRSGEFGLHVLAGVGGVPEAEFAGVVVKSNPDLDPEGLKHPGGHSNRFVGFDAPYEIAEIIILTNEPESRAGAPFPNLKGPGKLRSRRPFEDGPSPPHPRDGEILRQVDLPVRRRREDVPVVLDADERVRPVVPDPGLPEGVGGPLGAGLGGGGREDRGG